MKPALLLNNLQIADKLLAQAQLLEVHRENKFKVRAYRRAADTVRGLAESVADVVRRDGDLTRYAGIGEGIRAAIEEIVRSGSTTMIERLKDDVQPGLGELASFPKLETKVALETYRRLGISSLPELRQRLGSGEVARTMGDRVAQRIERAIAEKTKWILSDAQEISARMVDYLLENGAATRAEVVGDIRRAVEVIDKIVIMIEAKNFEKTITHFSRYGGGTARVDGAKDQATFRLPIGMKVTFVPCARRTWGAAQLVLTGSAAHLVRLQEAGFVYQALFRGKKEIPNDTAAYELLGLPDIPPELREGKDEVDLAAGAELPALIQRDDIRGELHAHSTSSDGADSIETMVRRAQSLGYEYLGITDHSQSLRIANGVSESALRTQIAEINRLNRKLKGFRILKSAEVDILADGALDYPDDLLAELDYTICSIHSRFNLGKKEQTQRILRAMDNPHFTILGHATGRKLLRRPGYEIDLNRIITRAKERGCYFEINSSPERLDLSAENARRVVAAGVKIAINTDAHAADELDFIPHGIEQARRAGLTRSDILNTLPWEKLKRLLRGARIQESDARRQTYSISPT